MIKIPNKRLSNSPLFFKYLVSFQFHPNIERLGICHFMFDALYLQYSRNLEQNSLPTFQPDEG